MVTLLSFLLFIVCITSVILVDFLEFGEEDAIIYSLIWGEANLINFFLLS